MKDDGIAIAILKKMKSKKEDEESEESEERLEYGQTLLDAIADKDAQAVVDAITALIHETV